MAYPASIEGEDPLYSIASEILKISLSGNHINLWKKGDTV